MEVVHLYYNVCNRAYMTNEQGEGWSLSPWENGSLYYEGDTIEEGDFILPDGYRLSENNGNPCIVLSKEICPIWTIRRGGRGIPTVYHPSYPWQVYLKRATVEEVE